MNLDKFHVVSYVEGMADQSSTNGEPVILRLEDLPLPKTRKRKQAKTDAQPITETISQQEEIPPLVLTPKECEFIYRALGEVECTLATQITKCPKEIAEQLKFTPSEIALLSDPTSKILSKYGSSWLSRHKDEVMLIVLLIAVQQAKLVQFRQALTEYRKRQADQDGKSQSSFGTAQTG